MRCDTSMKGMGNMSEARKGMLLVISGASGTGKGTVIKELMAHDDSLVFSVSQGSRPRASTARRRSERLSAGMDLSAASWLRRKWK